MSFSKVDSQVITLRKFSKFCGLRTPPPLSIGPIDFQDYAALLSQHVNYPTKFRYNQAKNDSYFFPNQNFSKFFDPPPRQHMLNGLEK